MRSIRILALSALVITLASCGSSSGGGGNPVPGFLSLHYSTTGATDGAVLFKVQGGTIDSVTTPVGGMVQSGSYVINPSFTRVVAAGNITNGVIARIHVPDVSTAASYTATIEQLTDRTTFAQLSFAANHSITITNP